MNLADETEMFSYSKRFRAKMRQSWLKCEFVQWNRQKKKQTNKNSVQKCKHINCVSRFLDSWLTYTEMLLSGLVASFELNLLDMQSHKKMLAGQANWNENLILSFPAPPKRLFKWAVTFMPKGGKSSSFPTCTWNIKGTCFEWRMSRGGWLVFVLFDYCKIISKVNMVLNVHRNHKAS